jgi:hypothetical protein
MIDSEVPQRIVILRQFGGANYPFNVCERCGSYAAEDSGTQLEEYIEFTLADCEICLAFTKVASPRDFGLPTFYTYENGAPVKRQ